MAQPSEGQARSKFVKLYLKYVKEDQGRGEMVKSIRRCVSFGEALRPYEGAFAHIGSGSYADVFRLETASPGPLIVKLIRLLPDFLVDRIQGSSVSRSTKYTDALAEYRISLELSKLSSGFPAKEGLFSCQMFPQVYEGVLTHGESLPGCFQIDARHKSAQRSEDMAADYLLPLERESLLIVMEDCGEPMRQLVDTLHPWALLSMAKQILAGFAVAELAFEFEHRDLHSGNVLLQPCQTEHIVYQFRRQTVRIPSHGYRVKIIDTTFSRMRSKTKVHCSNLSHLFENFDAEKSSTMKMQDQCYEQMSQWIAHQWQNFFPKTNLLWLKYVIHKLLRAKPLRSPDETVAAPSAKVKQVLEQYYSLVDQFPNCTSCLNAIIKDRTLNDCVKILSK